MNIYLINKSKLQLVSIILTFMITSFLGCVDKVRAIKTENAAKKISVKYINEKYGRISIALKSECQLEYGMESSYDTSRSVVTVLTSNFKKINVLVDTRTGKAADDSESSKFKEDVNGYLSDMLKAKGLKIKSLDICGGDINNNNSMNFEKGSQCFLTDKYDGNIEQYIESYPLNMLCHIEDKGKQKDSEIEGKCQYLKEIKEKFNDKITFSVVVKQRVNGKLIVI